MTSATYAGPLAPHVPAVPSGVQGGDYGYQAQGDFISYIVRVQTPAPEELRVTLEVGREEGGAWARIPALDLTGEGADYPEAFRNLLSAAYAWLTYLRDEQPDLADDLASQTRYAALLDAPVFSWFESAAIAE